MTYIFHIRRQERPRSRAYWQDFSYDGQPGDSVAQALMAINEDSPLQDRNGQDTAPIRWQRSCLVRKCGACAMVINGVPSLACSTFLSALSGPVITLEPLSLFPVVADLIVDRSFLYDRLKDWQIWLDQPAAASPWTWKIAMNQRDACSVAVAWKSVPMLRRSPSLPERLQLSRRTAS